jgi:hypothetical protein
MSCYRWPYTKVYTEGMQRCHVIGGEGDMAIVRVSKDVKLLGERGTWL